ncbi:PASTA domain-containing protein [Haloechinothrix halophila]|uniref:PASTA domain-containing protein n=1 Tax=Haloechinothrix halophila TaxID=1069073 RepID=UPI0012FBF3F9|nr:PASTA domain-containing protein [Haloechinothrix halophila]
MDVTSEAEPETTAPAAVKMPAVKGTNLKVSVHKLEKRGFTDIVPLPVDGHAFAANYANWRIVGQDPAAGKRVRTDIEITLKVAKTDEAENSFCLDNDC